MRLELRMKYLETIYQRYHPQELVFRLLASIILCLLLKTKREKGFSQNDEFNRKRKKIEPSPFLISLLWRRCRGYR